MKSFSDLVRAEVEKALLAEPPRRVAGLQWDCAFHIGSADFSDDHAFWVQPSMSVTVKLSKRQGRDRVMSCFSIEESNADDDGLSLAVSNRVSMALSLIGVQERELARRAAIAASAAEDGFKTHRRLIQG